MPTGGLLYTARASILVHEEVITNHNSIHHKNSIRAVIRVAPTGAPWLLAALDQVSLVDAEDEAAGRPGATPRPPPKETA